MAVASYRRKLAGTGGEHRMTNKDEKDTDKGIERREWHRVLVDLEVDDVIFIRRPSPMR